MMLHTSTQPISLPGITFLHLNVSEIQPGQKGPFGVSHTMILHNYTPPHPIPHGFESQHSQDFSHWTL